MGGLIRLKGMKHYQPRSEVFAGTVKVPEHVQFWHVNVQLTAFLERKGEL